ncbi:MAG: hypothetical protein C4533_01180 [Candidatus Omnitrophota bacterium]|jgi:hypothetical protein|nr:MAG: hypothetical protein C4533_01180 [Candidatus Omnitrophota bacterium]
MNRGNLKKLKRRLLTLFVISVVTSCLAGCAGLKEATRGVMGTSTKILEEGKAEAVKKSFQIDYNSCDASIRKTLKRIGAYIYRDDPEKRMIAVYLSYEDTTPVGIFLTGIDAANTQIEVSSPSKYAKEFIAQKIFFAIENPKEAEGETNEIK